MGNLMVVNGSYRQKGYTYHALMAEAQRLAQLHNLNTSYHFLPDDLVSCRHCKECVPGCRFINDEFPTLADQLRQSERLLIGSPVYLDLPSPKLTSFIIRLNSFAESTQRDFFKNKKVHIMAVGLCSGTKKVIHDLMGACEMLGFTIEGRSTKEYVILWKDGKVRGGLTRQDACFIKPEEI